MQTKDQKKNIVKDLAEKIKKSEEMGAIQGNIGAMKKAFSGKK